MGKSTEIDGKLDESGQDTRERVWSGSCSQIPNTPLLISVHQISPLSRKFHLTVGLCLAASIVSFLVLFKNTCSTLCSLYDLDDAPEWDRTVGCVALAVVADTAILIAPLLLNTLMTIVCMVAVLLLPSKKYSGSILQVYRKVSACLIFRVRQSSSLKRSLFQVVGTIVNVFLILSLVINRVYFYVIILTGEEVFPEEVMEALYVITDVS